MTDARKPSEKPIVPDFLVWHCANCGAAANATKKPCDCATNVGVRTGPNGKREQTWWDDLSSDTPTYDQLSALCAQMAAAVKAMYPYLETSEEGDRATQVALSALTAYRTLSTDPQWQRVPEGCVVVHMMDIRNMAFLAQRDEKATDIGKTIICTDDAERLRAILDKIFTRARGEG